MFENVKNLEELKAEYRRLAMIYHPDQGGSEEEMKRVNSEYDRLFPVFQRREIMQGTRKESNETAQSTRREFYTQNGWAGENYDSNLTLKEISNIVRAYVKTVYPAYKFSITQDYLSISVAIVQGPVKAYKTRAEWNEKERSEAQCTELRLANLGNTPEEIEKQLAKSFLTDEVKKVVDDVNAMVNSYRMDDSDSMIDYFHTNFYFTGGVTIGTWQKPYTVKEHKGKPSDGTVYEPVQETRTKKEKYNAVQHIRKPDVIAAGQKFVVIGSFTGGASRGYVYQIESTEDGYIRAYKLDRKLKNVCKGWTRGNYFSCTMEKFVQWIDKGALSFCEIVEKERIKEYTTTVFKAKRETKPSTRTAPKTEKKEQAQPKPPRKSAEERAAEVAQKNAELKAQREARKAAQAAQAQKEAQEQPKEHPKQEPKPEQSAPQAPQEPPKPTREQVTAAKQTAQEIEAAAAQAIRNSRIYGTVPTSSAEFMQRFRAYLEEVRDRITPLAVEYIAFEAIAQVVKDFIQTAENAAEDTAKDEQAGAT